MKKQKAKIITLTNQKGGTGKTTTALSLYYILKNNYYKVLFIDLDKQANASTTLKGNLNHNGTYEMLTNGTNAQNLIQVINENDYLICANKNLINTNDIKNLNNLKNSLKDVLNYFDFIIIDTPPNINGIVLNALTNTDYLIGVCEPSSYSINGIKDLNIYINEFNKKYKTKIKINGILVNKYKNNINVNKILKQELETFAKEIKTKVFKTTIRQSTKITESQDLKIDIYKYAKKSNLINDYINFTNEILNDLKMKEIKI